MQVQYIFINFNFWFWNTPRSPAPLRLHREQKSTLPLYLHVQPVKFCILHKHHQTQLLRAIQPPVTHTAKSQQRGRAQVLYQTRSHSFLLSLLRWGQPQCPTQHSIGYKWKKWSSIPRSRATSHPSWARTAAPVLPAAQQTGTASGAADWAVIHK